MTSMHSIKPASGHQTARSLLLAAAVLAAGLGGAARVYADQVDLAVVDRDTGRPLRVWRHDGHLFVAGRPGSRYSLRVTNNTRGRVLVVLSVDGVNIISGQTADYDQRGYIFKAHEAYDLSGWRRSDAEIAAFVFAPLPKSYAARTGRPGNVGVIGMAVFDEKPPAPREVEGPSAAMAKPMAAPPPPPPEQGSATRAAPGSQAEISDLVVTARKREEKLGTGYGEIEESVINIEPFERASANPRFIREVRYDSYDNLVASGVIRPAWNDRVGPRPFPARPDGEGYVPDPPPER